MIAENGLYLGDIDPNNDLGNVMDIRRMLLYRLLVWDSIVLSDSQFLTDARIQQLMVGFPAKWIGATPSIAVEDWHRGFEMLLSTGLVEVAHRSVNGVSMNMADLWTNMDSAAGGARVPYLPETIGYARYLDKQHHQRRTYELSKMGERFRNNLHSGLEKGAVILNKNNLADGELLEQMELDEVLFRNLLQILRDQLAQGMIDQVRYNELYNFIQGCYASNISAETNCSFSAKIQNVPFHLPLGEVDIPDDIAIVDSGKLRPTWAINPFVLDLLPMDGFLRVRKAVEECIRSGALLKYQKGTLSPEELSTFYAVWAEYTEKLELALRQELVDYNERLQDLIDDELVSRQQRVSEGGINIIKTVVGVNPAIGAVITAADLVHTAMTLGLDVVMLHTKRDIKMVSKHHRAINRFLIGHKSIITKHVE